MAIKTLVASIGLIARLLVFILLMGFIDLFVRQKNNQ